ncbi:heavy-metal-associated domain-containing protein [Acidiphilium sp.]|uniref:CopZ family metallochaperone n=1 Tax=Acidiphilium sp. TaxID=527 RepID=UPI0025910721|nr:heavy metal-associated domain-containing protein [Acidiphilium sp.]
MSAMQNAKSITHLSISGMTCSGCVNSVSRALSRVAGVSDVAVDLDAGRASVTGSADPQALLAAVEKAGYEASLVSEKEAKERNDGQRGCGCG